ncbi:ankyrin-1-like [Gigantopelta aegis]|uniref:ankyrin-1-like n=1 Tax=Gigantopelta aegis TaxID=1735272 RepID=UPI001B889E50|nr:ankyrin-1-like [Gigantopelta aegis]
MMLKNCRETNVGCTVNKYVQEAKHTNAENSRFSNLKHSSSHMLKDFNPKGFIQTAAYNEAEKKLQELGIVSLIGSPGSGKTTFGWILVARICQKDTKQPLYITDPSQIDDIPIPKDSSQSKPKDTYVVFIDDMFGKGNLLVREKELWEMKFERIKLLVTFELVKVIISSRTHIFSQCENSLKIREFQTFLNFTRFSLNEQERLHILELNLEKNKNIKMTEDDKTTAVKETFEELGFPQCCRYFVKSSEAQKLGVDFFRKPIQYLKNELALLNSNSPLQYLVLLLVMFKQGFLETKYLTSFEEDENTTYLMKKLTDVCGNITRRQIIEQADSLRGVYLKYSEVDECYSFVHQSVFDTLFLLFSSKYIEHSIRLSPAPVLAEYVVTPGIPNPGNNVLMVEEKHFPLLAQRFTDLLKQPNNARSVLAHPSFIDERFVECLMTKFWDPAVLNDLLSLKLPLHVEKQVMVFNLKDLDRYWKIPLARHFFPSHITNFTSSSAATVAVIHSSRMWSKYLADELVKPYSRIPKDQHLDILEAACLVGNSKLAGILLKCGTVPDINSLIAAVVSNTDDVRLFKILFNRREDLIANIGHLLVLAIEVENEKISNMLIDRLSWIVSNESTVEILDDAVKQLLLGIARRPFRRSMETRSAARLFRQLSLHSDVCTSDVAIFLAASFHNASILKVISSSSLSTACQGDTPFIHAVAQGGCLESLEILVHHGCNVSSVNDKHETAMHVAAAFNSYQMIEPLLKKGLAINAVDCNQNTPLHTAILYRSFDSAQCLVENGAQVNLQNRAGHSPLHYAVCTEENIRDQMPMVGFLSPQSTRDENSAQDLSFNFVSYLVGKGVNINLQNEDGNTPLHFAVQGLSFNIVNHLVEHGGEINQQNENGNTPLHYAAQHGSVDIVSCLVENQAELDAEDKSGNTPLHLAARNCKMENISCLVDKGAQVDCENIEGCTPLIYSSYCEQSRILEYLLRKGANSNHGNTTAVHAAAAFHCKKNLQVLLDRGEDVNVLSKSGSTPLHMAVRWDLQKGLSKTCLYYFHDGKYIDDFICDDFLCDKTDNMLLNFKKYLQKDSPLNHVGHLLLDKGCCINTRNKAGKTALHVCVEYGQLENLEFLLQRGADVSLGDKEGNSVLHYATARLQVEVV